MGSTIYAKRTPWIFAGLVVIGLGFLIGLGCEMYDSNLMPVSNPTTGEVALNLEDVIASTGMALGPVTGGLSGLAAVLAIAGLKFYREAKTLGSAISQINASDGTPNAEAMVKTDKAKAAVRKVLVNS